MTTQQDLNLMIQVLKVRLGSKSLPDYDQGIRFIDNYIMLLMQRYVTSDLEGIISRGLK